MKNLNLTVFALSALFFFTAAPSNVGATGYSAVDEAFKRANLARLAPYGPGANEQMRPFWARFIELAAKYRDYEIASRMFDLRRKADDATSRRYALDLLALYRTRPAFFVRSAHRYFSGDYGEIFAVWFDGSGEVSLIDLQGPAKLAAGDEMVQQFLKVADSADQRMMSRF